MTAIRTGASESLKQHSLQLKLCAGCGCDKVTSFFEIERLPVHVGMLHDSRESALQTPMGSVSLAYCHRCGLVCNQRFDPASTQFAPGYHVALHHSEVFRSHIDGVVERLIARYDMNRKRVLEIGCGDGYFLRRVCELGANRGIGIDPTVGCEGETRAGRGSVQLIRDFYTDRFVGTETDFVCCLSVFEDIPDPTRFLNRVGRMLGPLADVPVYFEVFNALRSFESNQTWSIHYEQCNYFSQQSLVELFTRYGFEVLDVGACCQGDQYLFIEAKLGRDSNRIVCEEISHDLPHVMAGFAQHYRATKQQWERRLDSFRQQGERVVLWGCGGKGISFLNALNVGNLIECVVEINPDKQGNFITGCGQRIVPPEFLADYQPDQIIITNTLYEQEIREQARGIGLTADFAIA